MNQIEKRREVKRMQKQYREIAKELRLTDADCTLTIPLSNNIVTVEGGAYVEATVFIPVTRTF